MSSILSPVPKQSLADDLAVRIRELIFAERHGPGDRLPAIALMAKEFSVGAPTVREALKKLETLGVVDIRHGSGVYVGADPDSLMVSNPVHSGTISKKVLVDLIEARIPIETTSARLAAVNASADQLRTMGDLLDRAGGNLHDAGVLNQSNLGFHRQIAIASGNLVIRQMLDVLTSAFRDEQRLILDISGTRERDHREHREILETLESRDADAAAECMHQHLDGVRVRLLAWDATELPFS